MQYGRVDGVYYAQVVGYTQEQFGSYRFRAVDLSGLWSPPEISRKFVCWTLPGGYTVCGVRCSF